MNSTKLIAKIVGPVLLLRALSIVIDRQHFVTMLNGIEREVDTVSFSFIPIVLLMAGIAIVVCHADRSTLAGILVRLMAWGAIAKASILILFPDVLANKVSLLQNAGVLDVVLMMCAVVGAYFTWFGYFAGTAGWRPSTATR